MTVTNVMEDTANQCFLDLLDEDDATCVGSIAVDSGHIELGDCGVVQERISTALGDGLYPVWKGKKYLVIEIDALNIMRLEEAIESDQPSS